MTTALNLLMVFIYFTIMFVYNVKMTLVLIAFVIPIMALTALATPKIKNYAREVFTASTESKSFLMEALAGVETIKGMGIERPVRLRWEKKYAKALEVQYRAHAFSILVGLGSQLLNAATTIAILWVGANLVLAREMTIGQLIAFNAFMGSVLGPLMGLVGLWSMLNDAGVAMERLGDVLDIEPEQKPQDLPSRVMLPELQGEISLNGVYFRYGEQRYGVCAGKHQLRHQARRTGGDCRPQRVRQDDARQAAGRLLRADRGQDDDRRLRPWCGR